jgi:hypothetical protein
MPNEGSGQRVTRQELVTMPADDIRNDAAVFDDAGRLIWTLEFWMDVLRVLALLADALAD